MAPIGPSGLAVSAHMIPATNKTSLIPRLEEGARKETVLKRRSPVV